MKKMKNSCQGSDPAHMQTRLNRTDSNCQRMAFAVSYPTLFEMFSKMYLQNGLLHL